MNEEQVWAKSPVLNAVDGAPQSYGHGIIKISAREFDTHQRRILFWRLERAGNGQMLAFLAAVAQPAMVAASLSQFYSMA